MNATPVLLRRFLAGVLLALLPIALAAAAEVRIATCQFPVSADIAANGGWIRKQMVQAKALQADIVHFSEAALSGYAGEDFQSFDHFDWERQHEEIGQILALAKQLRVWVVLGATHRLGDGLKPFNSLYVISPEGKIVDRYDKRFCTRNDLKHYSPGGHFVTFDVNGVRCGLLICYDDRFPELYREYSKLGVRLLLQSFDNVWRTGDDMLARIAPPTMQANAADNGFFVSMNNSSARESWESRFITPDGMIEKALARDTPGVMVNEVDLTKRYYDASRPFRADAIAGKLNSGETPTGPAGLDRTSY